MLIKSMLTKIKITTIKYFDKNVLKKINLIHNIFN